MKVFQLKPTNANVIGAASKPKRISTFKIGTRSLLGLRHCLWMVAPAATTA